MERLLKLRLSIVLVAVLGWTFLPFFFGSRSQHLIDRWVPRQDSLADQHDVDLLRQRDFEPLEKEFDPELANSDVQSSLSYMASMFPAEQPITVKVVDVSFARGPESKGVSLTFEYQFSKEWLLAHLDTRSQNGVRTITGFQVKEMETSLESANRFTLANKGSSQYAALLLQILDLGFSFYGFALCLQVIAGWKKWLWAAGTLVGVGQLSLNWSTGESFFTPLSVRFPPVGAHAAFYGPWFIYSALPVGAVLFFVLRGRLSQKEIRPAEVSAQHNQRSLP